MADIKKLSIFGNKNSGLDKIKEETELQKENQEKKIESKRPNKKPKLNTSVKSNNFTRSVGAPIRNHDQVFSARQPLKLSAIAVSLTRILSEKYMAESSRDEIIRLAINDFIKHNLTKEDKQDLLNDMKKELSVFREKYPTYTRYDEDGRVEATVEQIEAETLNYLKDSWGINLKN